MNEPESEKRLTRFSAFIGTPISMFEYFAVICITLGFAFVGLMLSGILTLSDFLTLSEKQPQVYDFGLTDKLRDWRVITLGCAAFGFYSAVALPADHDFILAAYDLWVWLGNA